MVLESNVLVVFLGDSMIYDNEINVGYPMLSVIGFLKGHVRSVRFHLRMDDYREDIDVLNLFVFFLVMHFVKPGEILFRFYFGKI